MALGSNAHKLYGQGQKGSSVVINSVPRNKYLFTVELTYDNGKTLVLERIANVMMPSFVYRTQTINKYNAKSIIQTGIDYTPITLTAYDTKDAVFENFLKDYAEHYFAGPMNEDDYNAFLTDPKGLQLRDNKNYITMMTITRVDSMMTKNVIEIFHPFITNADADTLDYSDSSPSVFRVSFAYEGYNILSGFRNNGRKMEQDDQLRTGTASAQVLEGDMGAGYYKNQHAVANPNGPPGSVYASNKPELYGYHPVTGETGSSHQAGGGMTTETGSDFMFGDGSGFAARDDDAMTTETGSDYMFGDGSGFAARKDDAMTTETGTDYMFGEGPGFAARKDDTMEATDGSGYADLGKDVAEFDALARSVLNEGETLTEIDGQKYVKSSAIVNTSLSGKTGEQ